MVLDISIYLGECRSKYSNGFKMFIVSATSCSSIGVRMLVFYKRYCCLILSVSRLLNIFSATDVFLKVLYGYSNFVRKVTFIWN